MTIAAEATEAKSLLLLAECRRCISIGCDLKAPWIKAVIAEIESASITNTSTRTDVTVNNLNDGRNAAEVVVIT